MWTETLYRTLDGLRVTHRPSGVLIAASGGADSTALLHLLAPWAARCKLRLEVAHLDHGLRPESADDARFVVEQAEALGVRCQTRRIEVADRIGKGRSLEMAAREARLRFLQEAAANRGLDWIALGHHRDDQVETILLRSLRGTGVRGLAGMRVWRAPWLRPLLNVTKPELLDWLSEGRIVWREDKTNAQPIADRNRLRLGMERLEVGERQRLTEQALAVADVARQVSERWSARLQSMLRTGPTGEGILLGPMPAKRHAEFTYFAMNEALRRVAGDGDGLTRAQFCQLLRTVHAGSPSAGIDLDSGVRVERLYDSLWFRPADRLYLAVEPVVVDLSRPGNQTAGPWRVTWQTPELFAASGGQRISEDFNRFSHLLSLPGNGRVMLRTRRAGDRFRPPGMPGPVGLKRWLINRKVPAALRGRLPLMCLADDPAQIVCVCGVAVAAEYLPRPGAESNRLIEGIAGE